MKTATKAIPKVYRPYFHLVWRALTPLVGLSLLTCVGLWLLYTAVTSWSGQLVIPAALFIAVPSVLWWHVFCLTWRIVTHDATGEIEFVGLLGRRHTQAVDVVSIKPDPAFGRNLVVSLRSGAKVPLYHHFHFDGFHEFLTWLKAVNPSVELRGC